MIYTQNRIINAYNLFFKTKYSTDDRERYNKTQNMCYLLKLFGIRIDNFGFTLNWHGAYSPGLLAELYKLEQDTNPEKEYPDFGKEETEKIIYLRYMLDIENNDSSEWMEILGTTAYIKQTIYPGCSFEIANRRLNERNLKDDELNKKAWDELESVWGMAF